MDKIEVNLTFGIIFLILGIIGVTYNLGGVGTGYFLVGWGACEMLHSVGD